MLFAWRGSPYIRLGSCAFEQSVTLYLDTLRKFVFNQTYLQYVHERETHVTEGMCSSLIEFFEQDILEEKGKK